MTLFSDSKENYSPCVGAIWKCILWISGLRLRSSPVSGEQPFRGSLDLCGIMHWFRLSGPTRRDKRWEIRRQGYPLPPQWCRSSCCSTPCLNHASRLGCVPFFLGFSLCSGGDFSISSISLLCHSLVVVFFPLFFYVIWYFFSEVVNCPYFLVHPEERQVGLGKKTPTVMKWLLGLS